MAEGSDQAVLTHMFWWLHPREAAAQNLPPAAFTAPTAFILAWDGYWAFWIQAAFSKAEKERNCPCESVWPIKPRLFHKGVDISISDRDLSWGRFIFTAQHAWKLHHSTWKGWRDPQQQHMEHRQRWHLASISTTIWLLSAQNIYGSSKSELPQRWQILWSLLGNHCFHPDSWRPY